MEHNLDNEFLERYNRKIKGGSYKTKKFNMFKKLIQLKLLFYVECFFSSFIDRETFILKNFIEL